MKVGLSATMIQGGRSGVGQYVFALIRELLRQPEVELTVFVLGHEAPLLDFASGRCRLVEVPAKAASPVRNILWHQLELPGVARAMGLDVLHVPSYRRLIGRAPCPTVGTIHDLAPFHVDAKYDAARMIYGRVVVKQLARRQTQLVAVSQYTANDIERFFGIPAERIRVIHNGIDHERFCRDSKDPGADEVVIRQHGLDKPYFLYVSRLEHPGKNHVRLIQAFEKFKKDSGSEMVLALGGGDWHGSEVIHEAAAASPCTQDIRFLGFVPDVDLPALYRRAHAMIYPSLFEGFGLPPVEAMACGTAVISSTRGALAEVVAAAALTVEPEDVEGMAEAMCRVAGESSLVESLQRKGLANAGRFEWSRTAQQMMDVYRQAIG